MRAWLPCGRRSRAMPRRSSTRRAVPISATIPISCRSRSDVQHSIRRRGRLLLVIGALGLSAVAVAAPRVIGALLETALRSAPGHDVDRVTFAWPARLHVEGLRLR